MDTTHRDQGAGHAAMVALATRVGLLTLGEAQLKAYEFLRDPRFFQCTVATTAFVPSVLVKLPASVRTLFDEFEAITLVDGDLVLARSIIKRSMRHPRLVQVGVVGVSIELASHRFVDTVYEIEMGWRSPMRPRRCASIWHYLVIAAATADSIVSRSARSLAARQS